MIVLSNLQKTVGERSIVRIDALTVEAGEIAAVVGPAGSGVDELFNLLTGQSEPSLGTITLGGIHPHADRAQLAAQVGILFPQNSLYERLTPLANLRFYCKLYGLPGARAGEVLSLVGLADHSRARLDDLTAGMRRRLDFGRAVLHAPGVLLLDDPFAECDDLSVSIMAGLIRRFAGEGTAALILMDDTTHLTTLCDTIYRFEQGQIVDSYRPADQQAQSIPFKIPARLDENVVLLNPADILYAVAEDGRTFIHTDGARYPTQFTLSELEERLARSGFFRAHRSYLVNLQHVTEVIPFTRNSFSLRLADADGTTIPLSKTSAAELRDLFGY